MRSPNDSRISNKLQGPGRGNSKTGFAQARGLELTKFKPGVKITKNRGQMLFFL